MAAVLGWVAPSARRSSLACGTPRRLRRFVVGGGRFAGSLIWSSKTRASFRARAFARSCFGFWWPRAPRDLRGLVSRCAGFAGLSWGWSLRELVDLVFQDSSVVSGSGVRPFLFWVLV